MTSRQHFVEALTVAMVVAPGVYSRNRMFEFFTNGSVRRAKSRSAMIRGVVPQLVNAIGVSITSESTPRDASGEPTFVLRYRVASMRLSRVVELTPTELAALRLVAARANVTCLPTDETDRVRVHAALAGLFDQNPSVRALARAAEANVDATEPVDAI